MALPVWVIREITRSVFSFHTENEHFASEKETYLVCPFSGGKIHFCSIFSTELLKVFFRDILISCFGR